MGVLKWIDNSGYHERLMHKGSADLVGAEVERRGGAVLEFEPMSDIRGWC